MSVSAHTEDKRKQLLDALYASLHEVPSWYSFLDRACHLLSCDLGAMIIAMPGEGRTVQVCSGLSEEQTARFVALETHNIPGSAGSVARQSWDEGEALFLSVGDHHRVLGIIVLCRTQAGATVGEDVEQILCSIRSAMVRAIQIHFRISYLERRKLVLEMALETSRIGIVLANSQGQVLLTNAMADRILAADDGLRIVGGHLHASSQSETVGLIAELARSAREQCAQPDWARFTPVALTRTNHDLPLTLIVRPGPPFGPLREPFQRTAMLILRDPALPPVVPAAIIGQLFGLSPAESLLASELARGSDLERAAATIGVSRNTVRAQLQNIFLKTGTKRQVDLIRMVLSSAAMSIFSPDERTP